MAPLLAILLLAQQTTIQKLPRFLEAVSEDGAYIKRVSTEGDSGFN